MNNSKILKRITVVACAAVMGLGVISGCNSTEPTCEHKVVEWVTQQATCTTAGSRTGKCVLCEDVIEEVIPVNSSAHEYPSTWQITKPSESAKGVATKTCKHSAEHVLEVELPEVTLSGAGYTEKEFITVPTPTRDGEMKLTLANENGAITFNVPLAQRRLTTLEDAIIVASSLKENVRSVNGNFAEANDGVAVAFAYYFGDNYTYIADKSLEIAQIYYHDEGGKVSAVSKNFTGAPNAVPTDADLLGFTVVEQESVDENLLKGYHYNAANTISSFYGVEEGLAQIYEVAKNARANDAIATDGKVTCVDYKETFELNVNQSVKNAGFSYGYYSGGFFYRFNVNFSTYVSGTVKSMTVKTEIIRPYMIATEEDGTPLFYKEGDSYIDPVTGFEKKLPAGDLVFAMEYPTDSEGGPAYEYKNGKVVYEQVDDQGRVIYQKEEDGQTVYYAVLGVDKNDQVIYEKLDQVPTLHDVYLKDCHGTQLVDSKGNPIRKKMARGGYPVNSYYSDNHSEVNYRSVTFNQTEKKDTDVVPLNPYDKNNRYITNFEFANASLSQIGNEIPFVNGTATLPTNVAVYLNIGDILPATASLRDDSIESIYAIDKTGNKIKLGLEADNGSMYKIIAVYSSERQQVTLNSKYAGEVTLLFKTQGGKCEKLVTLTFAKSAPSELTAKAHVYTVAGGIADYVDQTVSLDNPVTVIVGQSLKFRAIALGAEAGYVSTDILPTEVTGLTFTQSENGSYEEWNVVASQAGEYIVKMPYYDGTSASATISASFKLIVLPKQSATEKLVGNTFSGTVLMSAGANTNPEEKELSAAFGADGVLTITVAGNTVVYNYTISAEGEITIEHVSGVQPTVKSYDFSFKINEGGDLVVIHETGMGYDKEEIVLTKA